MDLGKAAVIQWRWLRVMTHDEIVAQCVELTRCHAWPHMRRDHVETRRGQLAGTPHALEIRRGVKYDPPGFGAAIHV